MGFIFVQCHSEERKLRRKVILSLLDNELFLLTFFVFSIVSKEKGKYHQMVKQNKKLIKTLSVKRTKAILALQTRPFYGKVSNTKFKSIPKQEIKKSCVKAPQ